jgi:hypothetical protein
MARANYSGLLSEREYEALVKALSSNAKGRAFLSRHIERARPDETRKLLAAVRQIEASLSVMREQLLPETIAAELRRISDDLRHSPDDVELRARLTADLAQLADDLTPVENN